MCLEAVIQLQRCWRRTLRRRVEAAIHIQYWWRVRCHIPRQRALQIRAAARIQAAWRGFQTRRCLTQLAAIKRDSVRPDGAGTGRTVPPVKASHERVDPIIAKRLIDIRARLHKASQAALSGQCLASRASRAIECILHSRSVSQVFDAIKCLELCTRLSGEVCYWTVGVDRCHNRIPTKQFGVVGVPENPCLHLIFLHLIQGCNRSIPHEDILLSVAGTLLNLARHRPLAESVHLWWTVPTADPDGADPRRWISPALLDCPPRLDRSESLNRHPIRACGGQSTCSELGVAQSSTRRRDCSVGSVVESNRSAAPIQTSMVEALMGILLRTCRARPGTPGVKLFTRVCCVLSILCEAIPPVLVPTGSLIPVCEQLSDCLARRSSGRSSRHLHLSATQERSLNTRSHSAVVREQVNSLTHGTLLHSQLRNLLSYELDWHLYPTKTRPDPLVAVDYFLLTLLLKARER
ncbi:unnamed protein product [Echinostoma caproni]|uniref:Uncharacterized protein n=1 Tax=Echinostoma caproni TaxID=27848 RepID=A0A183A985_9TREM|nr:unnamed protein product [Echinostoma caproni]